MDIYVRVGRIEASFSWRRVTVTFLTAVTLIVGVYQVLSASRALGQQLGFENRGACMAAGGDWHGHLDTQSRHGVCLMQVPS
jgi:hypothetical protein